jgi:hypothetical protein
MNHRRFAAFLLLPLAACAANYDFAQARLPGGGYDVNKLIVDLKASGERRLQDGSWFPLIHLERVVSRGLHPDDHERLGAAVLHRAERRPHRRRRRRAGRVDHRELVRLGPAAPFSRA